jgi:SAM-dependent methyltransferase
MDLTEAAFWDARPNYRNIVNDFTLAYSQEAWRLAQLPGGARVIDIAAGAGALARCASEGGARLLATDFSTAMVASIEAMGLPGVVARVMDGQALDVPDESFDAAFSMFGIMLFADWQRGLAEMARVLKPGGTACIGTWHHRAGAAANLLLADLTARLFPAMVQPAGPEAMVRWTDEALFAGDLAAAGLMEARFHAVTTDFVIDGPLLDDPDRLFQFSPIWPLLETGQRRTVTAECTNLAADNGGTIAVPSTAQIAIASVDRTAVHSITT